MKFHAIGILAAVVVFAGACAEKKAVDPGVCDCAAESLKATPDSTLLSRCTEMLRSKPELNAEYSKCLIAARSGMDTSNVNISRVDSVAGVNLPAPSAGSYMVDTKTSSVQWMAKKVTGKHSGMVSVASGSVEVVEGVLKGGELVLDMTTIAVKDLTGESKTKLENHLRSEDFFDTGKFGNARFVIREAVAENKHQFKVKGDLTIKGQTHPIECTLLVTPGTENSVNINGGIPVDRTLYGIKYGSGKFFEDLGDDMIDDVFFITVNLRARK